jgi:cytoskeletal protein RodZ
MPMDTFGTRLQTEREDRGLTIQVVAERLGVEQERLLALERNDFQALPDDAAMMACLNAYAECLEVDAELMIEDYVRERNRCLARLDEVIPDRAVEIAPTVVPSYGNRESSFRLLPVVYVMAAVVVVMGAWWMLSGDGRTTEPEPQVSTAPLEAEPVATPPEPTTSATHVNQIEAPPRAERPAAVAPTPAGMSIDEYGVGTAVKKRQLVGQSDRFAAGTKVWFWTRVEGGKAGDRIEHVWFEGGRVAARIPLEIGGTSWRTYSAKALPAGSSGAWAVEARDAEGRVLARREFATVR